MLNLLRLSVKEDYLLVFYEEGEVNSNVEYIFILQCNNTPSEEKEL